MLLLVFTFQSPIDLASAPSALNVLNSLILAIFLIGIGFLSLLLINQANRREQLERKRRKREGQKDDLISQYPYMTREELKEMVLRERAQREQEKASMGCGEREANASSEAQKTVEDSKEFDPEEASISTVETLLVEIGKQMEEDKEPVKPKKPKHDLSDKIERSILSHEIPEEFKGKSRRI